MTVRDVDASRLGQPSFLATRLDSSLLRGHFVFGRSLAVQPDGWHRRELDGWILLHEPSLPALDLLDETGARAGWILGHPLDLDARTLIVESAAAPSIADRARLERWLYGHGGRFATFVVRAPATIYPDAAASLPIVFARPLEVASSSPFLLESPERPFPDAELVDALDVFRTGRWFPLGATPRAKTARLLPNHALDLATWMQTRRWPTAIPQPDTTSSSARTVADVLERTLEAVASATTPDVGFTAGGDSRTFVACSSRFVDRLRFFTVAFPDDLGRTDLHNAPRLAEGLGLDYRVLAWREATKDDVARFMYRTGCAVGERRGRRAAPSYDQLGRRGPYVSGVGAEMARGIGWRPDDRPGLQLDASALVSRFGFPLQPEIVRRAEAWLADAPPLDGLDLLTLFHLEMRFGCWGGALTTAYPDAYTFTLYPYAHRDIADAVLRVPWADRATGRLRDEVIAARAPELSSIAINRRPLHVRFRYGIRRSLGLARRAFAGRP